jgi:NAD-dependent DNA ligase
VEIFKRGDVIPAVERVNREERTGQPHLKMRTLVRAATRAGSSRRAYVCPIPLCPDQTAGVVFFIRKEQMDFEDVRPETAAC